MPAAAGRTPTLQICSIILKMRRGTCTCTKATRRSGFTIAHISAHLHIDAQTAKARIAEVDSRCVGMTISHSSAGANPSGLGCQQRRQTRADDVHFWHANCVMRRLSAGGVEVDRGLTWHVCGSEAGGNRGVASAS